MSVNRSSPEIQNASPKSLLFDDCFQSFNINHSYDDGATRRPAEENNNSSSIRRYVVGRREQNSLEAMFEKPLTPSDVGKLNRLVIPKQHAERHFPLGGDDSNGTLLSFEDEAGKLWRFRYSYWNSSQSYVFTKGWSRYVKEKRLEAGDVVLFERLPSDPGRLFIGWRRRHNQSHNDYSNTQWAVAVCSSARQSQPHNPESSSAIEGVSQRRNASSGTLRLFGVNVEYQFGSDRSEAATPDGSSTSSPSDQVHQQDVSHRQPRR